MNLYIGMHCLQVAQQHQYVRNRFSADLTPNLWQWAGGVHSFPGVEHNGDISAPPRCPGDLFLVFLSAIIEVRLDSVHKLNLQPQVKAPLLFNLHQVKLASEIVVRLINMKYWQQPSSPI